MPATPDTIECRAVAERLRAFPSLEGNTGYLQKLGDDAASLAALTPQLAAVEPPVDQAVVDGLADAVLVCQSASGCSGNTGLWPRVTAAADAIDAACDAVETVPEAPPEGETKGKTKPAPKAR